MLIWSIGHIAMIVCGAAVGLLGLWLLFKGRAGAKRQPLHLADEPVPSTGLTVPTQLTVAIVTLIWGYSLIVWAFPRGAVGVQLNREIWYVWVVVGMAAMGLSLLLDKFERRVPPNSGDTRS